jgi:hypothetical protein
MNRRQWLSVFSIFILIALVMLASSLHDVQFQPGRQLPTDAGNQPQLPLPVTDPLAGTPLWKIILTWAAFLVFAILLLYLLPPEIRKRLIKQVISFTATLLALYLALRYRVIQIPALSDGKPVQSSQVDFGAGANLPAPTFQPPAMTSWAIYVISLVVLLTLLILAWFGYRWWRRFNARSFSNLDALAEIARSSLDDLASGREVSDVIIQSYVRMSEVVKERRGLHRDESMTPREFETRLESAGLPAHAVKRLTRLFESVRYGARSSSPSDINEAMACLNSIVQACGAAG